MLKNMKGKNSLKSCDYRKCDLPFFGCTYFMSLMFKLCVCVCVFDKIKAFTYREKVFFQSSENT